MQRFRIPTLYRRIWKLAKRLDSETLRGPINAVTVKYRNSIQLGMKTYICTCVCVCVYAVHVYLTSNTHSTKYHYVGVSCVCIVHAKTEPQMLKSCCSSSSASQCACVCVSMCLLCVCVCERVSVWEGVSLRNVLRIGQEHSCQFADC